MHTMVLFTTYDSLTLVVNNNNVNNTRPPRPGGGSSNKVCSSQQHGHVIHISNGVIEAEWLHCNMVPLRVVHDAT